MPFCLPKFATDALKQKFISGEITPEILYSIKDSAARREFLAKVVGTENAKQVNALFESKIPLKNQQAGLINWGEKVLGMRPEIQSDFLSKVKKIDQFMSPERLDMFLEDALEKRLRVHVSIEEIGKLVDLSRRVTKLKDEVESFDNNPQRKISDYSPEELLARTEYGTALSLFKDFHASLKPSAKELTFKDFITTPSKYIENLGSISKSIVASLDNSFWGNQGISTLLNPSTADIWAKNFIKSFGDIAKGLKGIDPVISAKSDAYSRPNAINGTYEKAKIATGLHSEEAYPTSLPERIPLFGRLFKASSGAYNAASIRMRADLADRWIASAAKNGVDIKDTKQILGLGRLVNSSTGRGSLGVLEPATPKINVLLFSGKLMKGSFDTLTAHIFDSKVPLKIDANKPLSFSNISYAQKRAAYNLLNITAAYIGITTMIEALNPGSTEQDPRGAHFGQVKIGNTYFNLVGPYRPLIRTLSTALPTYHNGEWGFWRKNAQGKWDGIKLFPTKSTKYGTITPLDLVEGFVEGKASPLLSTIMNHWRGADWQGKLPTPSSDISNLTVPITAKNFLEDKSNPKVDNLILNTILNATGFNSTTESKKNH